MAFAQSARVRVTDNTSQHRGRLGVVMSVSGDNHNVRLDGFPSTDIFADDDTAAKLDAGCSCHVLI